MKLSFVLLSALSFSAAITAQSNRGVTPISEDLPRIPADTLSMDVENENEKVIIHTNSAWNFYFPNVAELLDNDVFHQHWDTTQVFAYKSIQLSDLPQTVELELIKKYEDFHAPITGRVFSKYGPRGRRNHNGVDIPLKVGDPVYATFGGKIRYAKYNYGGFGNLVIIRHENGLETWYAHLSKCNVKENEYVKAGSVIGFGGSTGRSRGPHLHFEMRYCDQTFDPEHLIDFQTGDLRYMTFELDKTLFSIYSRASENLEEDYDFEYTVLNGATGLTSDEILSNLEAHEKAEQLKPKPTDPVYHTIKSGDTLGKIASRYGTTVDKLCKLNNMSKNSTLRVGNRIRVR